MEPGYEVGDVVRLKSGGPCMVVCVVVRNDYRCGWFRKNGKTEHGLFPKEVLEAVPDTEIHR